MNKKILCISDHSNMLGGGEYSYLDLLRYLPFPLKPIAVVPSNGELCLLLKEPGVETHIIQLSTIRPWFIPKILQTIKQIVNLCGKIQPVIIYANGSRAAFYGGLIGRILGVPVIWHCRITKADVYLDFLLARLSTRIVVNSKATAERFQSHFQSKVRVVYNGVDIEWLREKTVQRPELAQDEWKIILVVARVSELKRHDLALSAFEHVAKVDPKVHLVCLGSRDAWEPDWWDHVQEKTRQSPFSSRIHWLGQVDDVRPWYQSAHMLVLASENEAFGRVLVEAMACGVPVIATRSGGVPEIVRHEQDGLLVAPGKENEMAEAMAKILQNESFRKYASQLAWERARLFSLDRHVDRMIQVFEETISRPS